MPFYHMGLYYMDCQNTAYKDNFKPSYETCPHRWNFVEVTQEVEDKIAAEKRPKLSDKELAYPLDSRTT